MVDAECDWLQETVKALGAHRVIRWFSNMHAFLASAVQQPEEHKLGFLFAGFGDGAPSTSGIPDASLKTKDRYFGGRMNEQVDKMVFEWARYVPHACVLPALHHPPAEFEFSLAMLHPPESPGILETSLELWFERFFSGPSFVSFLEGVAHCLSFPDAQVRAVAKRQFPAMCNLFGSLVHTDRMEITSKCIAKPPLFSPSGTKEQPLTRVFLKAPLNVKALSQLYPGLLEFIQRLALLKIVVSNQEGSKTIFSWSFDGHTKTLYVQALKRGRELVWATDADLDTACWPIEPFHFDLTQENPLSFSIDLQGNFLGFDLQLPQISGLITSTKHDTHSELRARLTAIETTMLTRVGTFLLGIGDVFETIQRTLAVSLHLGQLEPDRPTLCAESKEKEKEESKEEQWISSLRAKVFLGFPKSSIVSLWMHHRMDDYVRRWLCVMSLFRDACAALHQDVIESSLS